MLSAILRTTLVALVLAAMAVKSDEDIYIDDALSGSWGNWGWNTVINWAATDLKVGTSSISAVSDAWAAVSLKDPDTFSYYAGIKFDIAADPATLQLFFQGTSDGAQSPNVPLSSISTAINPSSFTTVVIDFSALPPSGAALGPGAWDRITWQASGNGASVCISFVSVRVITEILHSIISTTFNSSAYASSQPKHQTLTAQ